MTRLEAQRGGRSAISESSASAATLFDGRRGRRSDRLQRRCGIPGKSDTRSPFFRQTTKTNTTRFGYVLRVLPVHQLAEDSRTAVGSDSHEKPPPPSARPSPTSSSSRAPLSPHTVFPSPPCTATTIATPAMPAASASHGAARPAACSAERYPFAKEP